MQSEHSEERLYDVIVESDVMAPMCDGIRLACDVYFPARDGKRVDGQFPAVLERTPYDKRRQAPHARYFAARGYGGVIQDCRGRFKSEGEFRAARPEAQDGYDTIEWLAHQPWCNGRVGTLGISFAGSNQGAAGALNPPHLCSMIPTHGFSFSPSIRYRFGGAARLCSSLIRQFTMVQDAKEAEGNPALKAYFQDARKNIAQWLRNLPLKRGHNPFSPAPEYEDDVFEKLQQSEWNEYYNHVSFDVSPYWDQYSPADVLLMGGWYDSHGSSPMIAYLNLVKRKGPLTRLLVGPWKHGQLQVTYAGDVEFGPEAAIDFNETRRRWFDMTLKQQPSTAEPPIRLFVMGGGTGRKNAHGRLDHGGRWRCENEWPPATARATPLYLHPGGKLSLEMPGASRPTAYQFDPRNPVPTIGGPVSSAEDIMPAGGFDQVNRPGVFGATDTLPLAARHDVCVFQTERLEQDVEVVGPLEFVLYASSDCVDTDFTGKLIDAYPPNEDYPAGYALNIQDSIIRARYRNRREPPEFLEPGKVYEFRMQFFPTGNVFKEGHRIRLDVSSSNFPRFDVNPNTGEPMMQNGLYRVATNAIYHDPLHPSHIVLPIVG